MDLVHRDSEFSRKQKKKKHDRSRSRQHKNKKDKDRHQSREHKKKDKEKKHHKEKSRQPSHSRDRSRDKKQRQLSRDPETERSRYRDYDRYDRRSKERDRSKEKKHKQKDYRRSRSRDKKKNNSRKEDTYERWRKQRDNARFRFDSPPKSDDSVESEDPEKMNRLNKLKAEKQLVSSKADRKLYLGNLPPNITSNQLMVMLNTALKKMDINTETEGDSIVSSWVSPDGVGHYAFVEFRTAQEATAGLALNGASLYGYQLKLGRPKQYIEYQKQLLSEFGTDGNIDTIIKKVQAMGGFSESLVIEERLVHPPSRVLILKHIVTIQELAIDEEYNEIMEDVTEMANRHGDVLKIVIPKPAEIDLEEVKRRVKGLGFVFIKYKSVEQARYARKEFIKQMFSQRSVACSYFSEERFDVGDLDPIEKVVIDF